MAAARPFLSAAPALGDGEEIHGRLRDAGLPAARHDARGGRGALARGRGPAVGTGRLTKSWVFAAVRLGGLSSASPGKERALRRPVIRKEPPAHLAAKVTRIAHLL